jgi:hypothetical protein
LLADFYSTNGAIPILGNADFFRDLGFTMIYQRDNDYGNDKAAQRLISWMFAVGGVIPEINLVKKLLMN